MSLRAKPSGRPKPALFTSMSIGCRWSVSRCDDLLELLGDEEVGDDHLDPDAVLRGEVGGEFVERATIARDEHEVGAAAQLARFAGGELAGVLGAEPRARAGDQCSLGHADEPRRTRSARSAGSGTGCRCAKCARRRAGRHPSRRKPRGRSAGPARHRARRRTRPDGSARSLRAGRPTSIVDAKIAPPPMTQIHSGSIRTRELQRRVDRTRALGAVRRPVRLSGDDDVAASGQRPPARIERVPRGPAHDDRANRA